MPGGELLQRGAVGPEAAALQQQQRRARRDLDPLGEGLGRQHGADLAEPACDLPVQPVGEQLVERGVDEVMGGIASTTSSGQPGADEAEHHATHRADALELEDPVTR